MTESSEENCKHEWRLDSGQNNEENGFKPWIYCVNCYKETTIEELQKETAFAIFKELEDCDRTDVSDRTGYTELYMIPSDDWQRIKEKFVNG